MLFRLGLILLGWLLPIAAAHPTDRLNQAAYITLSPQKVSIELDFSPGELVAPQFVQEFGSNLGSLNSETIQKFSQTILEHVRFTVDNKQIELKPDSSLNQIPDLALLKAGGAQLQLVFTADLPSLSGQHQFVFENKYQPVKSGYGANVFVESKDVKIIKQARDSSLQVFTVDFDITQRSSFALWWAAVAVGLIAGGVLLTRAMKMKGKS